MRAVKFGLVPALISALLLGATDLVTYHDKPAKYCSLNQKYMQCKLLLKGKR